MTPDEYHDEPEYVDDLDSLIRYLEKEKDRLRKLIEDACEEWE
jgi:hypothetical protein